MKSGQQVASLCLVGEQQAKNCLGALVLVDSVESLWCHSLIYVGAPYIRNVFTAYQVFFPFSLILSKKLCCQYPFGRSMLEYLTYLVYMQCFGSQQGWQVERVFIKKKLFFDLNTPWVPYIKQESRRRSEQKHWASCSTKHEALDSHKDTAWSECDRSW